MSCIAIANPILAAGQRVPFNDSDETKIAAECALAVAGKHEISDACARVIASQWADGDACYAFATTGAVTVAPDTLWWLLFSLNGADLYKHMDAGDKLAADLLGTYLLNAGRRGPVDGWSMLWL